MTRRLLKRAAVAAAGLAGGLLLVLAVEVQLARTGPKLPPVDFDLDGPVGADGRSGASEAPRLRMLWLGDSTAAGVGASEAAAALPRLVAAGLDRPVHVEVLAVSGATVEDVVERQLPGVAEREPDVVLVSVGANDTTRLTRVGDFRRRYERLVGRLRELPAAVDLVLLGVPDMGAIPRLRQPLRAIAGWRGERLDAEIAAVARRAGAAYVDIRGATGSTFRRDPDRYFAGDDYHPSDAGYALWARAVLDRL